tara:strand:+ start:4389 stop:4898 length:510 start_codon:yes stop_codon:yes gene_type:complete
MTMNKWLHQGSFFLEIEMDDEHKCNYRSLQNQNGRLKRKYQKQFAEIGYAVTSKHNCFLLDFDGAQINFGRINGVNGDAMLLDFICKIDLVYLSETIDDHDNTIDYTSYWNMMDDLENAFIAWAQTLPIKLLTTTDNPVQVAEDPFDVLPIEKGDPAYDAPAINEKRVA